MAGARRLLRTHDQEQASWPMKLPPLYATAYSVYVRIVGVGKPENC